MGIIHGLIGTLWLGLHGTNILFLVPDMRKAEKLADVPMLRLMPRLSMTGMVLGILTLVTGVIFMFVKWGTNFGVYSSDPEARTVVGGFVLVLIVLVFGMGFLRPRGMALGKRAAELKPMDPLPEDFKGDMKKLATMLHISGILVALAFVTMILAINGGI